MLWNTKIKPRVSLLIKKCCCNYPKILEEKETKRKSFDKKDEQPHSLNHQNLVTYQGFCHKTEELIEGN